MHIYVIADDADVFEAVVHGGFSSLYIAGEMFRVGLKPELRFFCEVFTPHPSPLPASGERGFTEFVGRLLAFSNLR
jgi:hypothetical protein